MCVSMISDEASEETLCMHAHTRVYVCVCVHVHVRMHLAPKQQGQEVPKHASNTVPFPCNSHVYSHSNF